MLKQQDTIVYGVQIPGVEGRAGMAAIVQPEGGIDLNWFLSAIKNQLPSYAMPIFLRMVKELDITGMYTIEFNQKENLSHINFMIRNYSHNFHLYENILL